MLKLFINLLILSLSFFILGCGGASGEAGMGKSSYQIIKEREDFEQKANAHITTTIEANTHTSLAMLMDAHVKILYKIDLPQTYDISLIALNEGKNLNIHRFLIPTKEYYYDSVSKALYLTLEVPYIHLLDNELTYSLELTTTNLAKLYETKEYTLVFRTKPMADNGEEFLSFEYKNSFDDANIDAFIKNTIALEKQNAAIQRFSADYVKRHASILRVN
jgi:hypothetical protein